MSIQTFTASTTTDVAYASAGNTAVTFMTLCNYSNDTVTANVFVVPSTYSPDTTNIVWANLELTPTQTYQIYLGAEKLLLDNGDTIQVQANANTAVTTVTSFTSI